MLSKSKVKSQKSTRLNVNKFLLLFFFFLLPIISNAQCAMCRASLESEGNSTKLEAVNDGIVYLMVIPYILVGIVGYLIFRMYNKKKEEKTNL